MMKLDFLFRTEKPGTSHHATGRFSKLPLPLGNKTDLTFIVI